MKFTIQIIAVALFTLSAVSAYADCPAFTAGMVDATMLATQHNQEESVDGLAVDLPTEPLIYCRFVNKDWGYFEVFVGYYEDEEIQGNEARLYGRSPLPRDTLMTTRVFPLSEADLHTCRAQVLKSHVWKNFCRSLMQ
jgi:hypothetical protein